jgi:2-dehydro-3-deoxyphosphooctonate aldolase (KDO 8-P synthase)
MTKKVNIRNFSIGRGEPLAFIAGPCVIESRESCLKLADKLKNIFQARKIPFIFKASYDKANRTSVNSYRGPGIKEGIKILADIKRQLDLPILSDVHCKEDISVVSETLDIIQIPAFLCRQTDLILAAAKTGKPINVKKGQFLAPWDMKSVIEKIRSIGNEQILLTERGTTFGYNNLVSDMRSLVIMRGLGYPVIYDATHSVQLPGGQGNVSGGERNMVVPLARAAVATGCDGLFIEVHETPEKALSDAATMLSVKDLPFLIEQVLEIHRIVQPAEFTGSGAG